MSETNIVQRTLIKIGALPFGRFWRNNAGLAWAGVPIRLKPGQVFTAAPGDVLLKNGHPVKLGPAGIADIMGVIAVTITPDMVGQTIGVATALEGKTLTGKQREDQQAFERTMKTYGGEYYIFRSPDEALAIVQRIAKV